MSRVVQHRFLYPSPSFTPLATDTPAHTDTETVGAGTGVMTWQLKHAGAGDVRIRDDERLWALGGWDHR